MNTISEANLERLRTGIHRAQRELAQVVRDEIYDTDALRQLIYQDLPELYGQMQRAARYNANPYHSTR